MYLALLSCAHVSLNKAIKAQKTHCTSWIAFIDQAHVKTHVNNSYYFQFWGTQNGVKGIKSIDKSGAYTVGPSVSSVMKSIDRARDEMFLQRWRKTHRKPASKIREIMNEAWLKKQGEPCCSSHRKLFRLSVCPPNSLGMKIVLSFIEQIETGLKQSLIV